MCSYKRKQHDMTKFFLILNLAVSGQLLGLSCGTQGLHCVPLLRLVHFLLQCADSLVEARGLSSSEASAILVPLLGIELPSSALQGGFLTMGKSHKLFFCNWCFLKCAVALENQQIGEGCQFFCRSCVRSFLFFS